MTDQTPDPWQDVRESFNRECGRIPGTYQADLVDRALAAERERNQQKIARLEKEHGERQQYYGQERIGLMQAIEHRESVVAQRDEAIRQQAEQIATLTAALRNLLEPIGSRRDGFSGETQMVFAGDYEDNKARYDAARAALAAAPQGGEQ